MNEPYSYENAKRFQWSSVTGNLDSERVSYLERYIVGTKILDAGCGGGAYVNFLANKGLEVTGLEKSDEFIKLALDSHFSGTFIHGDITRLPFPDKYFDCTYCFDVLEHVDDISALKEMARVTTRRLILTLPKEDEEMGNFNLTFLHNQDKTHHRNYTYLSLENLISSIIYNNINIFPELPIPIKELIRQKIRFTKSNRIMNSIFRKSLNFLLKKTSYEDVYVGLVAIVDLI
ncbi:class I SAM-dependent methyltransferase [Planctomycetota bacterium]